MPDRPIRKGFDILEVAETIRQHQFSGRRSSELFDVAGKDIVSTFRSSFDIEVSKYPVLNIWLEMLSKARTFPAPQFKDDIAELHQEVDTLKLMVKSLTKTLESSNKTIGELSKEIWQRQTIRQRAEASLYKLCNAYVEMVSKIEIVKKIYVVETSNGLLCWTIIDTEPFNSTLCEPIYDAQVKIYKEMKEDLALDFHVLNLSELHDRKELESILPPSAKLVWQR
jgi:hypothetical protein